MRRGGTGLSLQGGAPVARRQQRRPPAVKPARPLPGRPPGGLLPPRLGEPVSLQACRSDFLQRGQSLCMPSGPGTVGFSLLFTEASVLTAAAFHARDSPQGPRWASAGWPTRPSLGAVPGLGLGHARDSVRVGECAQVGWHPPGSLPASGAVSGSHWPPSQDRHLVCAQPSRRPAGKLPSCGPRVHVSTSEASPGSGPRMPPEPLQPGDGTRAPPEGPQAPEGLDA